jgi:hypothetical protein
MARHHYQTRRDAERKYPKLGRLEAERYLEADYAAVAFDAE